MKRYLVLVFLAAASSLSAQRIMRPERPPVPRQPKTLFVGDSLPLVWSQMTDFSSRNWLMSGRSGNYCIQVADNFEMDIALYHPEVVHIQCGTDDLWNSNWQLAWTTANIERMVIYAKSQKIKVVLATIPPRGPKWNTPDTVFELLQINDWIRKYGRDNNIPVADYYSVLQKSVPGYYEESLTDTDDQLHPNAKGYALMLPLVLEAILKAD